MEERATRVRVHIFFPISLRKEITCHLSINILYLIRVISGQIIFIFINDKSFIDVLLLILKLVELA